MNPRLTLWSLVLVAFVIGCSESDQNLIAVDPTPYQNTIAFKAFVKNAGVAEITDPLEISGTAEYFFAPITEKDGEMLAVPTQELTLRVQARVDRFEAGSCVGEVSCQGCQPLDFREQPSYKLHRQYALAGVGSNVELTVEFVATRGEIKFSHAWIAYAD